MGFLDVAKEIVEESIKCVICVDDEFEEPYSDIKSRKEIDKKLYHSFSSKNCNVDICKYTDIDSIEKKLKNNDLLVLDWQLTNTPIEFKNSLKIIAKTLDTNIKYICIYTHFTDLNLVEKNIKDYFSGFSEEEIKSTKEKFYEVVTEMVLEDAIKEERLEEKFKDYADNKIDLNCLFTTIKKIKKDNNLELKEIHKKFNSEKCEVLFKKIGLSLCSSIFPEDKYNNLKISNLNTAKKIFMIEDKILMIVNKRDELQEDFVEPDKLYEIIGEHIYKEPNSYLTLLWIEAKNKFNNISGNIGGELQNINEKAFFHHKFYLNDERKFAEYLKEILIEEIRYKIEQVEFESLKEIVSYNEFLQYKRDLETIKTELGNDDNFEIYKKIKGRLGIDLDQEIIKLNHFYSCNKEFKDERNIRFGDIFISNSTYYVCITAKCDCANPSNIKNQFIFLIGNKMKEDEKRILNPEEERRGYFVDKDKHVVVEWGQRIFTVFIPNNVIKDKKIIAYAPRLRSTEIENEKIEFEFIVNQKESYTQRLANNAFGWANRVGINLSGIRKKENESI